MKGHTEDAGTWISVSGTIRLVFGQNVSDRLDSDEEKGGL